MQHQDLDDDEKAVVDFFVRQYSECESPGAEPLCVQTVCKTIGNKTAQVITAFPSITSCHEISVRAYLSGESNVCVLDMASFFHDLPAVLCNLVDSAFNDQRRRKVISHYLRAVARGWQRTSVNVSIVPLAKEPEFSLATLWTDDQASSHAIVSSIIGDSEWKTGRDYLRNILALRAVMFPARDCHSPLRFVKSSDLYERYPNEAEALISKPELYKLSRMTSRILIRKRLHASLSSPRPLCMMEPPPKALSEKIVLAKEDTLETEKRKKREQKRKATRQKKEQALANKPRKNSLREALK